MNSIRILVADDHGIVRMGVRFALMSEERWCIEDEASTFAETLHHLQHAHYDLLILDLNLGDSYGIHTVREVSDRYPDLPILVLSQYPEDPYALLSIHAGAWGYLDKSALHGMLHTAVDTILRGEIYLGSAYRETLPYGITLTKVPEDPLATLSDREYEVYTHFAAKKSNKEIAEHLGLSPKTISTYRTRILEKLHLSTTKQLIEYALHNAMPLARDRM